MQRKKQVFLGLIALFLFSVPYSKFLLSVSMIGMVFIGLFDVTTKPTGIKFRPSLREKLRNYIHSPYFWILGFVLVAYIPSGLWSSDLGEWWWRLRTKSPFLFLPLAMYLAPKLERHEFGWIWKYLVILCTLSLAAVLSQYLIDPEGIVELLYYGKPIPTPCHHIRYSLFVAFGGVVAVDQMLSSKGRWAWILGICAVLLAIGIHILAVRSGILVYYICLWVWILLRLRGAWKWILATVSLGAFALLPFLAYQLSPTFKQKMDYVKYDWEQFRKGDGANYSDSDRWHSIVAGYELFKENPILGVGIGDLKMANRQKMEELGLAVTRNKFPHNQWLFVMAGSGLLGLIIFAGGIFGPLFFASPTAHPLMYSFYVLVFLSFMAEHTVETAVGTALTVGMICLLVKEWRDGIRV